jgi:hypothetical protein
VTTEWQLKVTLAVNQEQVEAAALRAVCSIVGTHVLDSTCHSDLESVSTYKAQGEVECGLRFLSDKHRALLLALLLIGRH